MKKTITLFLTMLTGSFVSQAQVREFIINADSNSIVREISGDTLLIYTEVSPSESYFLYYTGGNSSTRVFRLTTIPTFLEVYDVRIWGKYAYFCGAIDLTGSGSCGLVGRFKIQDVFAGTGTVDYGIFDSCPTQDFYMKSLRRLDMYSSGRYDCMAMVGIAEYGEQTIYPVASAYVNGGTWTFHSAGQKDHHKFTDIACLDNLIVATGLNVEDQLCFVDSFWPYPNFPAHECNPGYIYDFTYRKVAGNPLIAQYKNDTAVLAYFDISVTGQTVLQRQPFGALSGKPLYPNLAIETNPPSILPYSTDWNLMDLTTVDDSVFLLQRAAYAVSPDPSILYDWRLRAQFSSTSIDAWIPQYQKQCSMDVKHARRITPSSYNSLFIQGPSWPLSSNSCQSYQTIDATYIDVGITPNVLGVISVISNFTIRSDTPTIFEIESEVICDFISK